MNLARRLWWGLVSSVALAVLAAGAIAWLTTRTVLMTQFDQQLRSRGERAAKFPWGGVRPDGRDLRPPRLGERLFLLVTSPDGAVLHRSEGWPEGLPELLATERRIVPATATDGRAFRLLQRQLEHDRPADERAWPPPAPGTRLLAAADVTPLHDDLATVAGILLAVGLAVLTAAVVVAGRLRDGLLAPLRQLAGGIAALPAARTWHHVPDSTPTRLDSPILPAELRLIAGRIDELLDRLDQARSRERRTLADIAHELRTPLAALRSDLDFASAAGELPLARAAAMRQQADLLQHRLSALMLLVRLEAGAEPLMAQSIDLVESLADAWARAGIGDRELALDLPDPAHIAADPGLWAIVLDNLFGNIQAHARGLGPVQVSAQQRKDRWTISIANPADGIDPAHASEVFSPFWRGEASHMGSDRHAGLGLAIVQRIAAAHGAQAVARGEANRFAVELDWPALAADHSGPGTTTTQPQSAQRQAGT